MLEVERVISDVRFRMVGPQYAMDKFDKDNVALLNGVDESMEAVLATLSQIPRMSTAAIAMVINTAVRNMHPDHCYVNIGTWWGYTLFAGMLGNADKMCVGVDNFSEFGGPEEGFRKLFTDLKSPAHSFHKMDYRTYFLSRHNTPIGVYMYDGSHDYKNQMEGLRLAEPYFRPGTVVLVDDINWPDPYNASMKFFTESENEYRVILDVKTAGNCHPTWWNGLLVAVVERVTEPAGILQKEDDDGKEGERQQG